jgi:hypothetical protein
MTLVGPEDGYVAVSGIEEEPDYSGMAYSQVLRIYDVCIL